MNTCVLLIQSFWRSVLRQFKTSCGADDVPLQKRHKEKAKGLLVFIISIILLQRSQPCVNAPLVKIQVCQLHSHHPPDCPMEKLGGIQSSETKKDSIRLHRQTHPDRMLAPDASLRRRGRTVGGLRQLHRPEAPSLVGTWPRHPKTKEKSARTLKSRGAGPGWRTLLNSPSIHRSGG